MTMIANNIQRFLCAGHAFSTLHALIHLILSTLHEIIGIINLTKPCKDCVHLPSFYK